MSKLTKKLSVPDGRTDGRIDGPTLIIEKLRFKQNELGFTIISDVLDNYDIEYKSFDIIGLQYI